MSIILYTSADALLVLIRNLVRVDCIDVILQSWLDWPRLDACTVPRIFGLNAGAEARAACRRERWSRTAADLCFFTTVKQLKGAEACENQGRRLLMSGACSCNSAMINSVLPLRKAQADAREPNTKLSGRREETWPIVYLS